MGLLVEKRYGDSMTQLGALICRLPLSPALAKAVVWAVLLGVVDDVVIIVAGIMYREPWKTGGIEVSLTQIQREIRRSKKAFCPPYLSDHIALLELYRAYVGCTESERREQFCDNASVSEHAMSMWADRVERLASELKNLLDAPCIAFAKRHTGKSDCVMAALAAALFPNMAMRSAGSKTIVTTLGMEASVSSSSIYEAQSRNQMDGADLFDKNGFPRSFGDEWLCFNGLTQVEECYALSQVSVVHPLALILVVGEDDVFIEEKTADHDPYTDWYDDKDIEDEVEECCLAEPNIRIACAGGLGSKLRDLRSSIRCIFLCFCYELQCPSPDNCAFLDSICDVLGNLSQPEDEEKVIKPMPNAFATFPHAAGKPGHKRGKGRR